MNNLCKELQQLNYATLGISAYNQRYIERILPVLDYYLDIYHRAITWALEHAGVPQSDLILVDYGGGHGFLSMLAKRMHIGTVIYVDINPHSVHTARTLGQILHCCPDYLIEGDSTTLQQWCRQQAIIPHAVVGIDVIEHIYRLDTFFASLFAITPTLHLLFTTASNPDNHRIVRRLHRIMAIDELGDKYHIGFLNLRQNFIWQAFLDLPDDDIQRLAINTRGMTYKDIYDAIVNHQPVTPPADPYNTCDPTTGSWTERILPLADYRQLLAPYTTRVTFRNGFYNTHRGGLKGLASTVANHILSHHRSHRHAPFLFIEIQPQTLTQPCISNC